MTQGPAFRSSDGTGPALTDFQRSLEPGRLYAKGTSPTGTLGRTVRILTWNIGRGHHPEQIADAIRKMRPDIACLQEVDWNNARTGSRDVLQALTERTGMFGLFGVEFLELQAAGRRPQLAGGGVTGNALLCRAAPVTSFRIDMPPGVDWQHGSRNKQLPWRVRRRIRGEPRIGGRFGIGAEFAIGGARLFVCSVHLEDKFGGTSARFAQYHAVTQAIAARDAIGDATVVVAGDFNTFDSPASRLLVPDSNHSALGRPKGVTEAEWWKRSLLPSVGFADPFPVDAWTFRVPMVFRGKLDWITARNGLVRNRGTGPFSSSDHRPIWIDLEVASGRAQARLEENQR